MKGSLWGERIGATDKLARGPSGDGYGHPLENDMSSPNKFSVALDASASSESVGLAAPPDSVQARIEANKKAALERKRAKEELRSASQKQAPSLQKTPSMKNGSLMSFFTKTSTPPPSSISPSQSSPPSTSTKPSLSPSSSFLSPPTSAMKSLSSYSTKVVQSHKEPEDVAPRKLVEELNQVAGSSSSQIDSMILESTKKPSPVKLSEKRANIQQDGHGDDPMEVDIERFNPSGAHSASSNKLTREQKLLAFSYESHTLVDPQRPRPHVEVREDIVEKVTSTESSSINEKRPLFLRDSNIKDKHGRRPSDPDYDPTTLLIPKQQFDALTDAKKQYYGFKREMFDTIIFFQQGDFFNIFGLDADVGVELGLVYNPQLDSVGINRKVLDQWKSKFLGKGYKVAVISQKNTAETAAAKQKKKEETKKKGEKTEPRVVTEKLSHGTIRDLGLVTTDDNSRYVLAIAQRGRKFAVWFIDVTTLEMQFCSFEDDERLVLLETILLRTMPKELLYDRTHIEAPTLKLLKGFTNADVMHTVRMFPSVQTARDSLQGAQSRCFKDKKLPELLETAMKNDVLALCFGGLHTYFSELLLEEDILPKANIQEYHVKEESRILLLDSVALVNLELIQNNENGSLEGTLRSILDRTLTSMGKRLLKRWIEKPLMNPAEIALRSNAVLFLYENAHIREQVSTGLRALKDLERLFGGIRNIRTTVESFLDFVDALEHAVFFLKQLGESMKGSSSEKGILKPVVEHMPDLSSFFSSLAFNKRKARQEKSITPEAGSVPEFDSAHEKVAAIQKRLDGLLTELKKATKCPRLTFVHNSGDNCYITAPSGALRNSLPDDFEELNSTKAEDRYTSIRFRQLVAELVEAEEELGVVQSNLLAYYVSVVDDHFAEIDGLVLFVAIVDVLNSLARSAVDQADGPYCQPEFVQSESAFLDIKQSRHPYIKTPPGVPVIPNDISLGTNDANAVLCLVTGPNMGGKSTLLRQACILVIMAQMGALVPAQSMKLTIVDQIFTRLGARDRIFANQSTFMLELSETSQILKGASSRSLVILDELGRGTSTFDGYSIAYGVIMKLIERHCLCLFATHYHKLTDEFALDKRVVLTHMDCQEQDGSMVFLYRLVENPCPKSYGLTVASMANLGEGIIQRAREISHSFENSDHWKIEQTPLQKVQRLRALADSVH